MQEFDVFIIGGGPAGKTLAQKCSEGGLRVGIAEPYGFGGTCTLRGCDPKRIMVTRTMLMQDADNLNRKGLEAAPKLDWPTTRAEVARILDPKPGEIDEQLRKAGVKTFLAKAAFTEPHKLKVGSEAIEAQHVVIATGQRPAPLECEGAAFAKTSDDFHHLDAIPKRTVFIGGGYIGMESAHFLAKAGSEVTILNNDDDPLPMFEPDLVERFLRCTKNLGIDYVPNAKATRIEQTDGGSFCVSAENKDGKVSTYEADLVMNTAGRVPNYDALELGKAGVESDKEGIPVDEFFRTNVAGVYAIGDIAGNEGAPLTPVAQLEAEALLATLLGTDTKVDYSGVATVVYGLPELATVGLMESAAREKGVGIKVVEQIEADGRFNAERTHARAYGYKVILDEATDKVLGAHLIGPQAGEQINLFALGIRYGLTGEQLRQMPFAYPTWGSDVSGMVR